jgi:flagellar hook-associated protein 3 FlgL
VTTGGLNYHGDANEILIESGPGSTMASNVPGGQLFTDAYAALESLKNNLQSGNPGAIGGVDIAALQSTLATINNVRGTVGARLQAIEKIDADHNRRIDDFSAQISDVEDIDISEAVMKFRLAETAYQAALGAASQGFRLSLVDFLT